MSDKLQSLLEEIRGLEKAVEEELHRVEKKMSFTVKDGRISFTQDVLKLHRSLRKGLLRYLYESDLLFILSAPVIYFMVVPAFLLKWSCWFYQAICFPIYQIPKVRRRDYIRMDRHRLAYLNSVEKINCDFCAYFNGTIAYAREIAARTEQYWCPIRHALAIKGAHGRYSQFVEFGNAEAYQAKLERLRRELQANR